MRTIPILLLALTIIPLQAAVHRLKFDSQSIGDSTTILICTPTNFQGDVASSYPVILMLHGWSGDETQWVKDSDLQTLSNRYQVLLVLPDGGYDGWWLDPAQGESRRYASHLHDEVLPLVFRLFRGNPGEVGALGLSMGGYGSVLQAFLYPESYQAVASLSGVLDLTAHTESYGIATALGDPASQPAVWEKDSPLILARQPAGDKFPAVQLICGWEDRMFPENIATFETMRGNGYNVEFLQAPGTHSHTFWKDHVETAVVFLMRYLR